MSDEMESVFAMPSVHNPNQEEDDDREFEEQDQKRIQQEVDDELENLSFDDDEDDASLVVSNHVHEEQQLYVAQPQAESTPYESGMMNPNQQLEQEFLYRQQPDEANIRIMYEVRAQEIDRLKRELVDQQSGQEDRIRTLEHNKALNERENNTLRARLENLEGQCQAQSETNRNLQSNIDELKLKLSESERNCLQLTNDLNSERLLCQTQQEQLTSYQRSGALASMERTHAERFRNLEENKERIERQLQQELHEVRENCKTAEDKYERINLKYQHQQIEHEKLMAQKSDMINDLLRKKQEAETKFLVAQNSSQGYANAKANYDEFQKDREKFAQELLAKDEEINSLKGHIQSYKQREQDLKSQKTKYENILHEKSSTIRTLEENLMEKEQRITNMMRESLSGSTSLAVQRLQEELKKINVEKNQKDQNLVQVRSELDALIAKYKALKQKIRLYKEHKEKKENDLQEYFTRQMEAKETYYSGRMQEMKDKIVALWATTKQEYVNEVLEIKRMYSRSALPLVTEPITEPPMPSPRSILPTPSPVQQDENDPLSFLNIETVKSDIKSRLKMPNSMDRMPFTQVQHQNI